MAGCFKIASCSFVTFIIPVLIMRFRAALNITFVTYEAQSRDGFQQPLRPAFQAMIKQAKNLYPQLLENSSLSHISLYYDSPNRMDEPESNNQVASQVNGFFQFYFSNQELFTPEYSERFTALITDSKDTPLKVFKHFIRGVPVLLVVADPQQNVDSHTLFPTMLNLVSSRFDHFYHALNGLAVRFGWKMITVICECGPDECGRNFFDEQCVNVADETDSKTHPQPLEYGIKRITLRADRSSAPDYDGALVLAQKNRACICSSCRVTRATPRHPANIPINAFFKNMTTHGDFVFVTIQLPVNNPSNIIVDWKANDANDSIAAQAFDSLLLITKKLADPNRMNNLIAKMAALAEKTGCPPSPTSYLTKFQTMDFLGTFPVLFQGLNRSASAMSELTPATFVDMMSNQSYETLSGSTYIEASGFMVSPVPVLRFNQRLKSMEVAFSVDPLTGNFIGATERSFYWFGHKELPPELPRCGTPFESISCLLELRQKELTIGIPSLISSVIVSAFLVFLWLRRKSTRKQFNHLFLDNWARGVTFNQPENKQSETQIGIHAMYENMDMYAKKVTTNLTLRQTRRDAKLCAKLLKIHDLEHPNIASFYGILFRDKCCFLCGEHSERGCLNSPAVQRLRSTMMIDLRFRLSLMADIVEALLYLHKSPLKFHGELSSSVCIVTSRFAVKLAHVGYLQVSALLNTQDPNSKFKQNQKAFERDQQAEDIRNTAVVFLELINKDERHVNKYDQTDKRSLLPKPFQELEAVIKLCLKENSAERPSVFVLQRSIKRHAKASSSIASLLMAQLERHSESLEQTVEERTSVLIKETEKVDMLLHQILPATVITQLRNQETVRAELFESATVLFSDIPIFSDIASTYAPRVVVEFLNAIYSAFDQILVLYDVYKVETINDSYVVTSGIPVRNGIRHATEICVLSLHLLAAGKELTIPVTDKLSVNVRIGINSGLIAAGIVGTRMPRYCLFGDAMNTASRMESHGKEGCVHVSAATQTLACTSEDVKFDFQARGFVEIKGKGRIETYWLLGSANETSASDNKNKPY